MQNADPLRVQAEVGPGPYFVGQGFELRVGVIAGTQRPKVDPPRMAGARAWTISTELRPISTSGIGRVVSEDNRFVFRFRVLPTRAGTLEIPSIQAQLKRRSGRSQPKTLSIQPLPLPGRPAEFLGGVGRFQLHAEAAPKIVRAGQELEFRIKVTGPAAWGMTDRPDLGRYARLSLGLRIEPRPDETTDEPPARTFVYRLRPTHPGEAVLPPVAIAAYDPITSHYITQVTTGVPIRVLAVPSFDPSTIHYDAPSTASRWPEPVAWAALVSAISLFVVYVVLRRIRRRLEQSPHHGPERARRFARKTARSLASLAAQTDEQPLAATARRIYDLLNSYLLLGTGQPLGVLTPDEARAGVLRLTDSDVLAEEAEKLTTRCDAILYGDLARLADLEPGALLDDARRLFGALGRVNSVGRTGP